VNANGPKLSRLKIQPEIEETAIVLVGHFGPEQFHPLWFAANDLMGDAEAKTAQVEGVGPIVTRFTTAAASVTVIVEQNRFLVGAPVFLETAFDLVLNTFERALPGQAISAFGINRTVHFDAGSSDWRNKVGRQLAPFEPWGAFGERIASFNRESDPLRTGGVLSLHMRSPRAKTEPKGNTSVRVEPSGRMPTTGIFMQVTDHYDVEQDNQTALAACTLLRAEWDRSVQFCDSIINHVMGMALAAKSEGATG
jgi:hypothetical protein